MDVVLSPEERKRIKKLISQVSEEESIDKWGKCGWYKTQSKEAEFDRLSVTLKQRRLIEEVLSEIMKGLTMKEARAQIHEFICPGHPRPSE